MPGMRLAPVTTATDMAQWAGLVEVSSLEELLRSCTNPQKKAWKLARDCLKFHVTSSMNAVCETHCWQWAAIWFNSYSRISHETTTDVGMASHAPSKICTPSSSTDTAGSSTISTTGIKELGRWIAMHLLPKPCLIVGYMPNPIDHFLSLLTVAQYTIYTTYSNATKKRKMATEFRVFAGLLRISIW